MNFKTINDFNIAPTKLIQGPEKVIVTGRPISLVIISESQITNTRIIQEKTGRLFYFSLYT